MGVTEMSGGVVVTPGGVPEARSGRDRDFWGRDQDASWACPGLPGRGQGVTGIPLGVVGTLWGVALRRKWRQDSKLRWRRKWRLVRPEGLRRARGGGLRGVKGRARGGAGMVLPSKEPRRGPGQPTGRPQCRVLAERNQSGAAVGVWVESAPGQQSPAFASASRVEEELKEQQRKKAASLRRFQGEVRQRVNRQARLRRRLELQKAYEAAERESCAAVQYSTPWKNTCLFQSFPAPIIRAPSAGSGPVQPEEEHGEPFQQQAAELSRAVQQVRRRLASRRILSRVSPGAWRQEEPDPCPAAEVPMEESEELLLAGHHDLPAELLEQGTAAHDTGQDDGFYLKIEFEKVCGGLKDSSLPGPPGRPHSECQPPLKLWAGVDQEEARKQRQSEFLRRRRLCMALERERARQHQRQQERQQRVAQIKRQKENQRRAEEQRMRDMAEQREPSPGEGTWEALAQLQLEEKRVRDKQQRDKEHMRYVEALRAQMREKVKLCKIDLPPLCSCGSDFWDSHPDTCANNCIFYKNHKGVFRVCKWGCGKLQAC
ncbi:coiled-coil domain-containing protein 15 isoform X3 [Serinus canaria]|uniref:coiled-coil domain-containing protein 15 isoform X3 n=1 Tax=Serinus canaria TaxID=9135 RepID=UPI0021CD0133|nr:coiled-coil domain-containing protein 15 isoform X3 [Serinus canaria]